MDDHSADRHWLTLSVPIGAFSTRMQHLAQTGTEGNQLSMHSRLSLIHQTAKLYATEAAQQAGTANPLIDIDELTNPPLLDLPIDEADEQQVLIRFNYQSTDTTDQAIE